MKKVAIAHIITIGIYLVGAIISAIGLYYGNMFVFYFGILSFVAICFAFKIYIIFKYLIKIEPKNAFQRGAVKVWKLYPIIDVWFIIIFVIAIVSHG